MHSRLRCMIRCVRASVNSVGLCRLAELYGRALVTIRVGGVALFFCYDCAGTVHIKRDSGRRDAALGGWLQRGEAARGSMALHCACGFIARCVAWESHARGSDCSRPQAKRVAHTHIHRARFLRGSRRAVKAMASSSACAMRWPRRVSKRSIE